MEDSRGNAGFTLLELIVVIAILSLMVMVAPRLGTGSAGLTVRAAAIDLAADLRSLRRQAVARQTVNSLRFLSHGYVLQPGTKTIMLPVGVSAKLMRGLPNLVEYQGDELRFFQDGSSSGGTVELRDGPTTAQVRVQWLGGNVTLSAR